MCSKRSSIACSWVDKRTIHFLSTLQPGNLRPGNSPPTVRRRLADSSQQEVVCPPLLPDYQAYMERLIVEINTYLIIM